MTEQSKGVRPEKGGRKIGGMKLPAGLARHAGGFRKLIINVVGVTLIVLATMWFADWVEPSLTSEQLFTPPVVGPQAVKVKYVSKKTLVRTVTYSGIVNPFERVIVRARTSGFVQVVKIYPGDRIKPGDLLVQLETSELLPRLRHNQARYRYLKAEFQRDEKLFKGRAISSSALELSRQRERVAAAQLDLLKTQIGYASIKALSDGWISSRKVDRGEFVRKGQELVTYERLAKVRIRFDVAIQDLVSIKVGTDVVIELRGVSPNMIKRLPAATASTEPSGDATIKAKVTAVFPRADEISRLGIVEVMIDNPGMALKSNAYVVGRFITGRVDKAWVVPNSALTQMPGGKTVIFIAPAFADQGEARMHEVTVGLRNGQEAQILKGLSEPAYVVISGNRSLTAGERVTVVERLGTPQ